MDWKNTLRKQDAPLKRDLRVKDGYAKDKGDYILFVGEPRDGGDLKVPKAGLNQVLDEYEKHANKKIERLSQITMSAGPHDDFLRWYRRNKE